MFTELKCWELLLGISKPCGLVFTIVDQSHRLRPLRTNRYMFVKKFKAMSKN
jgi:hypothetical protein